MNWYKKANTDYAYLEAVKNNINSAKKMIEDTAKNNGYNIGPVYHATRSDTPFYVFTATREGIHFGTLKQAESRKREGNNNKGHIISCYLKAGKIAETEDFGANNLEDIATELSNRDIIKPRDAALVRIAFWKKYPHRSLITHGGIAEKQARQYQINIDDVKSPEEELNSALERNGYNGLSYLNRYEGTSSMMGLDFARINKGLSREDAIKKGFEFSYIVFNSSQIKLSDAITRDDSGNIIPLSKRFDSNNPDIRY